MVFVATLWWLKTEALYRYVVLVFRNGETMKELMLPVTEYHTIVKAEGPLDVCLSQIKSAKAVPVSGEQLAVARVYNGEESEICRKGCWLVGYDEIRLNNGDLLMTLPKQSVILENPRKAVATHRTGNCIYLTQKQLEARMERASTDLTKAREGGVLRIPKNKMASKIPTNKYGEIIETQFVYGAEAKTYGDFLYQKKIESSENYVGDTDSKGAVACGLWVHYLDSTSSLNDDYYIIVNLSLGRVFGVQNVPAKRIAPKTPLETLVK